MPGVGVGRIGVVARRNGGGTPAEEIDMSGILTGAAATDAGGERARITPAAALPSRLRALYTTFAAGTVPAITVDRLNGQNGGLVEELEIEAGRLSMLTDTRYGVPDGTTLRVRIYDPAFNDYGPETSFGPVTIAQVAAPVISEATVLTAWTGLQEDGVVSISKTTGITNVTASQVAATNLPPEIADTGTLFAGTLTAAGTTAVTVTADNRIEVSAGVYRSNVGGVDTYTFNVTVDPLDPAVGPVTVWTDNGDGRAHAWPGADPDYATTLAAEYSADGGTWTALTRPTIDEMASTVWLTGSLGAGTYSLRFRWVIDGTPGDPSTAVSVTVTSAALATASLFEWASGTAPSVTLNAAYPTGTFADGEPFVVAPAGIEVTARTIPSASAFGTMIFAGNPWGTGSEQAPAEQIALNTTIPPGAVLAFATGDGAAASNTIGKLMTLTVLSARPPAGSFRPTVFRDATTARRLRNVSEMDLSRLPRVPWAVDGQMPSAAAIQTWFDRWMKRPAPPVGSSTSNSRNNYPSAQAGAYHRNVVGHFAYAGYVITSSQLTDENLRRAVAIAYVQRIIDVIGGFESKRARSVALENAYWWNGQIELAGLIMGDTRMRGIDFYGERGNNAYHAAANTANADGAFTAKIYRWEDVKARSDANGAGARLFSTFKADTLQPNTMGWAALLAPRTVTLATGNTDFITRMEDSFGITFDGVDEWTIPANRFNNGMDTWWSVNAGAYAGHVGLLDPTPLWPADANSPPSADTGNAGIGHFNRTYFVQGNNTSGWGDGAGDSPNSPYKEESYASQHGPGAVAYGLLMRATGLDDYLANIPGYLRFCEIWMTLPSGWYVANNLPNGYVSYNYQDPISHLDEGADNVNFSTKWMKARYLEHFDAPAPAVAKIAPSPVARRMVQLENLNTGGGVRMTLLDLPHDGYSPITDIEFEADGSGTWTSTGLNQIGETVDVSGFTVGARSLRFRAVNAIGAGAAGGAKSITVTAPVALVQGYTAGPISSNADSGYGMAIPAGAQEGDMLVAVVATTNANGPASATGWTRHVGTSGGTSSQISVLTREVPAGGLSGTVTFTVSGSFPPVTGQMFLLRPNGVGAIEFGAAASGERTNVTQASINLSSVKSGATVISVWARNKGGRPWTPAENDALAAADGYYLRDRDGASGASIQPDLRTEIRAHRVTESDEASDLRTLTMSAQGSVRVAAISVQEPALAAPSITSLAISPAAVGISVEATVVWTGYPRTGVTYQWTLDGGPISGATSATYTPVAGDAGGALRCGVTVDNGQGTDTATSDPQTVGETLMASTEIIFSSAQTSDSGTIAGVYPAGTQILLWLTEGAVIESPTLAGLPLTLVARTTAHSDGRATALYRVDLAATLTNPILAFTKPLNTVHWVVGIATAPQGFVVAEAANSTTGTPSVNLSNAAGDLVYLGFAAHGSPRDVGVTFSATGPGNIAANDETGTFGTTGVSGVSAAALASANTDAVYTATNSNATPSAYATMIAVRVPQALTIYTNFDPGGFTFENVTGTHINIGVLAPEGYAGATEVALADLYSGPVNLVAPTFTGTTGVGDTVTAVSGLWISAGSVPTVTRTWRSEDGVTQLGTGATYTVASGDVSGGIILRESVTDAYGGPVVEDTTVLVAVAASEPADFVVGVYDAVYDPSDLLTLWQDAAGTVPVTTDGQRVRRMDDKSGNNLHAIAASDAERPTYKTNGTLHWLEFNYHRLQVTTPAFRLGDMAVFAAVQQYNEEALGGRIFAFDSGDPPYDWQSPSAMTMNFGNSLYLLEAYANFGSMSLMYVGDGALNTSVVEFVKSGDTTAELKTNGVSRATQTGPFSLSAANGGNLFIGFGREDQGAGAQMNFYGAAIYTGHALTAGQLTTVREYLAAKAGVTL